MNDMRAKARGEALVRKVRGGVGGDGTREIDLKCVLQVSIVLNSSLNQPQCA